jgi:hypothetical protein
MVKDYNSSNKINKADGICTGKENCFPAAQDRSIRIEVKGDQELMTI